MYLESYKDLVVWQKSVDLVTIIFNLTSKFPKAEIYGLSSQMRRAAIAIPSNIAEGYGRRSKKEFRHFITISYGSALELETQLLISKRLKLIDDKDVKISEDLLQEVLKMLNSLIRKLQI